MDQNYLALVTLVLSGALGVLGWAFRQWAITLKESINQVTEQLEDLAKWMRQHTNMMEHRVTRLETKFDIMREEGPEDGSHTGAN